MSRALRVFSALVSGSNWFASIWIFALMLLVAADVAMRELFGHPIIGVNEVMELSMVGMVYLQITQALRDDRHTRSDTFFGVLRSRKPAIARVLQTLFLTGGLVLMLLIIWVGVPRVLLAYERGYWVGARGVVQIPEWPVQAVIVFGCTLMAIQFAILIVRTVRGGDETQASATHREADAVERAVG